METNYLIHHGVKGQKWGVRRYQNYDGTSKNSKGNRTPNSGKPKTNKSHKGIKRLAKVGLGAVALGSALAAYKNVGNIYVAKKYLNPTAKAVALASSKAAIQTGAAATAIVLGNKAFNPKQKLNNAPRGPYSR